MVIKELIKNKEDEFDKLCKEHSVKTIFAFGSSVTGNFDIEKSDIDILVEIEEPDPVERGEKLISLWDKLEAFFNRKVDLISNQVVRNPFLRQNIENSKVLIYGILT